MAADSTPSCGASPRRTGHEPKKIALGVTSSVSIYKACEVLRGFQKAGVEVQVVMTPNAARLVSPLLFGALSGRRRSSISSTSRSPGRSATSPWPRRSLCCASPRPRPTSSAKFANGVADDFLSTFYLASSAPVLVAPAMNEAMYLHPEDPGQHRPLKALGVEFVEPEKGYLACGDEGWGRLAAPGGDRRRGPEHPRPRREPQGARPSSSRPGRPANISIRSASSRTPPRARWATRSPGRPLARGRATILVSGPTRSTRRRRRGRSGSGPRRRWRRPSSRPSPRPMSSSWPRPSPISASPRPPAERSPKARSGDGPWPSATPDILKHGSADEEGGPGPGRIRRRDRTTSWPTPGRKLREKNLDLIVANDVGERESDSDRTTTRPDHRRRSGRVPWTRTT